MKECGPIVKYLHIYPMCSSSNAKCQRPHNITSTDKVFFSPQAPARNTTPNLRPFQIPGIKSFRIRKWYPICELKSGYKKDLVLTVVKVVNHFMQKSFKCFYLLFIVIILTVEYRLQSCYNALDLSSICSWYCSDIRKNKYCPIVVIL
uniref:Uncharacterized protein n=1 Tax=Glossina brevipalpis TaxID=37001 RepID=A0A1A9WUZ6_9MUSC